MGESRCIDSASGRIHYLTLLSSIYRFLIHDMIRLHLMFCRIKEKKGSLKEEYAESDREEMDFDRMVR